MMDMGDVSGKRKAAILLACLGPKVASRVLAAMADEEIRRVVAGVAPRLGNGDRRRIDHHHAEQQQDQAAPQQGVVDLGRQAAGSVKRRQHQPRSFCKARTH